MKEKIKCVCFMIRLKLIIYINYSRYKMLLIGKVKLSFYKFCIFKCFLYKDYLCNKYLMFFRERISIFKF